MSWTVTHASLTFVTGAMKNTDPSMPRVCLAALLFALLPWSAEAEPLAEFKVRLGQATHASIPVQVTMSAAKPKKGAKQPEWLRRQPALGNLRYDVRRTDS